MAITYPPDQIQILQERFGKLSGWGYIW